MINPTNVVALLLHIKKWTTWNFFLCSKESWIVCWFCRRHPMWLYKIALLGTIELFLLNNSMQCAIRIRNKYLWLARSFFAKPLKLWFYVRYNQRPRSTELEIIIYLKSHTFIILCWIYSNSLYKRDSCCNHRIIYNSMNVIA